MLQYDQLYQSLKKVSAEWHAGTLQWRFVWDYLKFYDTGEFIICSSSDNLDSVRNWLHLHKENPGIISGTYNIDQNNGISATYETLLDKFKMDGVCLEDGSIILRTSGSNLIVGEQWEYYSLQN